MTHTPLASRLNAATATKAFTTRPVSKADLAKMSGASSTPFFVHCLGRRAFSAASGHSGAGVESASIERQGRPMP
jgi:hypothetical protein